MLGRIFIEKSFYGQDVDPALKALETKQSEFFRCVDKGQDPRVVFDGLCEIKRQVEGVNKDLNKIKRIFDDNKSKPAGSRVRNKSENFKSRF